MARYLAQRLALGQVFFLSADMARQLTSKGHCVTALISKSRCMFLHVDSKIENLLNSQVPAYLTSLTSVIDCTLHRLSSKWIDNAALKAIIDGLKCDVAEEDRRVHLVSGAYLEDQVTVCSLEALIEGFDAHLLCDLISAYDVKLKLVMLLRLFQVGSVP